MINIINLCLVSTSKEQNKEPPLSFSGNRSEKGTCNLEEALGEGLALHYNYLS